MTLLPKGPQALIQMDAVSVLRSSATADSEGNPSGQRTVMAVTRGTLASLSSTETLSAAQRGTLIQKALAVNLSADLREGDWVDVRGTRYEVVAVEDRRLYRRALLRVTT